ncbi:P-loop containing nucleoside triphosphate hydrolase protein [Naematelia encephala]|uniref:gluconokinase n=1 Tax=Naematelia encephala TaxID=71784 RepID=A0A1Y2AN59_9TREE|nr:P-loop containing nucleoside triphosphate hydrolase protein [Naematelia encephala]
MVSKQAVDEFERLDEELTVPAGQPRPILIIVMGPASCGKSTIGTDLAESLSLPFIDGDSLHPQSNIDKMSQGHPLTDDDRLPWLALIRSTAERECKSQFDEGNIRSRADGGVGRAGVIIACSALKKWYRDILRGEVEASPPGLNDLPQDKTKSPEHPFYPPNHPDIPATSNLQTLFLYCYGSPEVLQKRIAARKGHFMGAQMLVSQLATLEDPRGEGGVTWVDIDQPPEKVAADAVKRIRALVDEQVSQKDP